MLYTPHDVLVSTPTPDADNLVEQWRLRYRRSVVTHVHTD